MSCRPFRYRRLAAAGALCLFQAAFAQVPVNDPATVLVTGSRFASSFESGTPVAATVITADEIQRSGASSAFEAMRRLGGLQTRSNLSGTPDDTIDLRGFGVTGDQNTLVLIDGQRVSENELQSARLSAIPLDAIERIEILRGQGAVLYGGGATGGVINIITKAAAPGQRAFTFAAVTGSYGTQELRAGAALAGESVAIDIAVNRAGSENYRRNNAAQQENAAFRLRLAGERGEMAMRIVSERQHAQLPGALSMAQYLRDPRQAAKPFDWTDTDANHYSLTGNYRFAWGEAAIDVFQRDKVNRFLTEDLAAGNGSTFTRSGSAISGVSPRVRITESVFGIQNQLVLGYDTSRWTYRNQASFRATVLAYEADLGTANLTTDETGKQYNRAWYFKDDFRLGDWRFSLGGRRENLRQFTASPLNTPVVPITGTSRDLHAEEVSAAWNFSRDWTLHGRLGNSYRIGNIDENRFRFNSPGFLLPQTSKDRELGLNYRSRAYEADIKLFEHALNNEIMCLANLNAGFCNNVNLPPTRRSGFEVSGKWRPVTGLDFTAFYAGTRAVFVSGRAGNFDVTGKEVPLVARSRASLQMNWQPAQNHNVNVGWQYTGSQIYDNDHANVFGQRIPAYYTLDARYGYRIGQFEIGLSGTNLLNRNYFAYGVTGSGRANVYPERPRALFVTMAGRF